MATSCAREEYRREFDPSSAVVATAIASGLIAASIAANEQPGNMPVACEKKRGPENVMLDRRRSMTGRTLEQKYKVNWSNVLGEGAFGSVHEASLKPTGDKVALKKISRRFVSDAFLIEMC
jgi:hypothetical protein